MENIRSTPALDGMPVLYLMNRFTSTCSPMNTLSVNFVPSSVKPVSQASTIEIAFFFKAASDPDSWTPLFLILDSQLFLAGDLGFGALSSWHRFFSTL